MTAAEFAAWMQERGLVDATAALLLSSKRQEVWRWRTGRRAIPPRVAAIVKLLGDPIYT